MLRTSLLAAGLFSVLLSSSAARGAVAVGDSPKLAFKATSGAQVNVEDFKGKYVLVDFWATWCKPCMEEAGHMVQVNEKYGPRGMAFVGVSLDADLQEMKQVAKQQNFSWPQYFDGQGWGNKLAVAWGVHSIPATFLIGPDGKLVWTGHPAEIDRVLEDAFKKNPPQLLDPKMLASAQSALSGAEKGLAAKDAAGAMKQLAQVPQQAKDDARVAKKYAEVQTAVTAAADAMLAEVEPLVAANDAVKAAPRLRDIMTSMRGTPTGDRAKQMLADLMAKPEVKAKLAAMDKDEKSKPELAAAKKLQAAKQDDQAYARYKAVAREFAGTDAGTVAAAEVAKYEKDATFVKRQSEAAVAGKAKSAISLAQAYARAGRGELAAKKYQSVIDDFPNTSFATQATQEMAALPK